MARPVGSPTSSSTIPSHPSEAKKRKGANTVENSFNVGAREELNVIIARMYYFGGLPFNTTAFTYATNNPISRYVPSRYNLLMTSLLQNEKANIERMLKLEPIKNTWKVVPLCSDGWSNTQRRLIINFLVVTKSGPMFLSYVNAYGFSKSKFYIEDKLMEKVRKNGHQNVTQIIIDNA